MTILIFWGLAGIFIFSILILWLLSKKSRLVKSNFKSAFIISSICWLIAGVFYLIDIGVFLSISSIAPLFVPFTPILLSIFMLIAYIISTLIIKRFYRVTLKNAWNLTFWVFSPLLILPVITRIFQPSSITSSLGCLPIKEQEARDMCYSYHGNCEKIVNFEEKQLCIDTLLQEDAIKKKDVSFCNKIKGGRRYTCLYELAKRLRDPSYCEDIPQDWQLKEKCIKEAKEGVQCKIYCWGDGYDFDGELGNDGFCHFPQGNFRSCPSGYYCEDGIGCVLKINSTET